MKNKEHNIAMAEFITKCRADFGQNGLILITCSFFNIALIIATITILTIFDLTQMSDGFSNILPLEFPCKFEHSNPVHPSVQSKTAICTLTLNMYLQVMFSSLYYWLIAMLVICGLDLFHTLLFWKYPKICMYFTKTSDFLSLHRFSIIRKGLTDMEVLGLNYVFMYIQRNVSDSKMKNFVDRTMICFEINESNFAFASEENNVSFDSSSENISMAGSMDWIDNPAYVPQYDNNNNSLQDKISVKSNASSHSNKTMINV